MSFRSEFAKKFLSEYGFGDIYEGGIYDVVPLFINFDFDLRKKFKKNGIPCPGLLQFVWEPFISYISEPDDNVEVGSNFLMKMGFLSESRTFQPYIKGGLGLLFMSQHTRGQSTQFNFNEMAGAGFHFFLRRMPPSHLNTAFVICQM